MGFIWFWLVAIMIVGYVMLDGFDLGVGVLHLFLVRNEAERRTTLASIGPVWDGNEVWLLAGGGTFYFAFPVTFIVPVGVVASLATLWFFNRNSQPVKAFLSSCLYLFLMLAGACWSLYPTLLPSTTGADFDITITRAISGLHTLAVGLVWWGLGMALAISYVVFVYTRFRGKVDIHAGGH